MYGDLSRPTAEPLAFDNDEQDLCRLSLLASALSGYPAFTNQLNALFTPPVSVTDLSSQLKNYTLQPEGQDGTDKPDEPDTTSLAQNKPLVNSPPVILLHRQSVIRRQKKSANIFQSGEQPHDEPGLGHSSLSSYPADARFLILPDQPPIYNSDPTTQRIEAEDSGPEAREYRPIIMSGHERMRMPLERPRRQGLVLKSIRYRKSARENKKDSQKRSAALSRALAPWYCRQTCESWSGAISERWATTWRAWAEG